eukprot:3314137-Rhodomonas_salina.1
MVAAAIVRSWRRKRALLLDGELNAATHPREPSTLPAQHPPELDPARTCRPQEPPPEAAAAARFPSPREVQISLAPHTPGFNLQHSLCTVDAADLQPAPPLANALLQRPQDAAAAGCVLEPASLIDFSLSEADAVRADASSGDEEDTVAHASSERERQGSEQHSTFAGSSAGEQPELADGEHSLSTGLPPLPVCADSGGVWA